MKLFNPLLLVSLISLIVACSGNVDKKEDKAESIEETEFSLSEGMKNVNLSEYNLNASILIPDESKGKADIQETEWGSIEIRVGNSFGIEIVPFGLPVEDKKTELASDLVFDIEYIVEEEYSIIYKKTIPESDVEPEFHFFMTVKIDGDLIEVKSLSEDSFKKGQVEKMLKAAKTLKINPEV